MNNVIWLWFCGVLCMQILPWTISGIGGLFQHIPQPLPELNAKERHHAKFFSNLMQNQVSILFIVPVGIMLMNELKTYGLIPSMAAYWYPVAFVAGVVLLALGIVVSKLTIRFMHHFIPKQLDHDYRQYAYNVQQLNHQNTWQRVLLGLVNGFSEEMIMRVFLMGFLIYYLHVPPPYAFALSVLLNGLHHTHQGRIMGVVSIIVIQSFYAAVYLLWHDFLLIGLMHVGADISGLLLSQILQKKQSS